MKKSDKITLLGAQKNEAMIIRIFIVLVFSAPLLACSNDPISVLDSSWKCETLQIEKECVVEFVLENKSPFVVKANIKVRAINRVSLGGGAISNRVIFEKQYYELLSANETKRVKKMVTIQRKFGHIMVVAWKNNE